MQQNTQWFALWGCRPWQWKRFNSKQSDLQQQRSWGIYSLQWKSRGKVGWSLQAINLDIIHCVHVYLETGIV